MSTNDIALAMGRIERVLRRRPETGLGDDTAATARWLGGTRVVASHASGANIATDMAVELGGTGDQVSPGWLFRAGLASCLATCVAMNAAARGIHLTQLEVRTSSRSDTRGFLGMCDANQRAVDAGSRDIQLQVRLGAEGVSADKLRELVIDSQRCAPVSSTLSQARFLALQIEIVGSEAL